MAFVSNPHEQRKHKANVPHSFAKHSAIRFQPKTNGKRIRNVWHSFRAKTRRQNERPNESHAFGKTYPIRLGVRFSTKRKPNERHSFSKRIQFVWVFVSPPKRIANVSKTNAIRLGKRIGHESTPDGAPSLETHLGGAFQGAPKAKGQGLRKVRSERAFTGRQGSSGATPSSQGSSGLT